jgi:hypothetical protein
VSAVRVSGRLQSATLAGPFPQTLLRLLPRGHEMLGFGAEAATTVIEPDGQFTFLNVPAGQYTLVVQGTVIDFTTGSHHTARLPDAPGFPGGNVGVGSLSGAPSLSYLSRLGAALPYWARMPVTVGATEIAGLEVRLHPTVRIRGRVVFADGATPPSRGTLVRANPANGDPSLGQPRVYTAANDPTHAFTLSGLFAGRYLLSSDNYAYRLVSIAHGGRDVTETGFDASEGRDFDDVVMTLTDRKAEITGVVTDNGAPVRAAVIVFPANPARWVDFGFDPPRFRTALTNAAGEFTVTPLPGGDYFVVAVDPSRLDDWTSSAFLAAVAAQATRLTLALDQTARQQLRLVRIK